MTRITIHAAKTNLSKLIAQVEAGEEVVICRGDKEVARLVPAHEAARQDRGALKGHVEYTPGWDSTATTGVAEARLPWGKPGAWDGKSPRKPGQLQGIIGPTPDDAFAPMTEEEIAEWENSPVFPPERT